MHVSSIITIQQVGYLPCNSPSSLGTRVSKILPQTHIRPDMRCQASNIQNFPICPQRCFLTWRHCQTCCWMFVAFWNGVHMCSLWTRTNKSSRCMMHLSLHLFVGSEVASTTIASPSSWALETRGKWSDDMLPETRGSRIGKTCFLMYGSWKTAVTSGCFFLGFLRCDD